MALHPHPVRTRLLVAVSLLAALSLLVACGDDTSTATAEAPTTATTGAVDPNTDPESLYCRVALMWQVHEMSGFDETDPAALHSYIDDYADFYETASSRAPEEIREDWELANDSLQTQFVPVFERYDYDLARMQAEGTPEEQAIASEPPPDVAAAQDRIHEFESRVCAAGQPVAATDVSFTGDGSAAYCEAGATFDEAAGALAEGGFEPAEIEAFATGDAVDLLTAMVDAAPDEIADDGQAVFDYEVDVRLPLMAAYDYDFRRIVLEGSFEERQQYQYTDPAIIDAFTRTEAYDEQVCGTEA